MVTTPLTGPLRAPGGDAGPAPPGGRAPADVRTGDRRQRRPHPRTAGRRRAALLVGLTLLAPVLAAFVLRRDAWVVTSDSVAQQSIVRTWFAAGHDVTYLPPDTWLLKVPLYVVVEALPLAPMTRLLVESAVLAAVALVAAAWATWELAGQAGLRRSRSLLGVLLPFAWFGTLSGGAGSYLVSLPNSRNVELGLALVVVAVAGRRLAGHQTWRRPSASSIARAGGTAVVAAVLLGDPLGRRSLRRLSRRHPARPRGRGLVRAPGHPGWSRPPPAGDLGHAPRVAGTGVAHPDADAPRRHPARRRRHRPHARPRPSCYAT